MPLEEFFPTIGELKKGVIVNNFGETDMDEKTIPIRVMGMRKLVKRLSDLYYAGKPPSKEEFNKIFKESEKEVIDEAGDFIDQLELSEDFFKVEKRIEDKKGNVTIKFKKISREDRIKVIRSIATKMVEKLSKEQLISLLEEGIKKNSDLTELDEIDKDLDKEDVKIDGRKGCFKLIVNNRDILVMR